MSAQFTLYWSNTKILSNTNVTAQRAVYRLRSVGGSFISSGFTPTNDMAKSVVSADSPSIADNVVAQFKIQSICTVNGPRDNDNGIKEAINFTCISPTITKTHNQATVNINITGLDITGARFTLKKTSDNSIVQPPILGTVTSTTISYTKTGLVASTSYYWEIELYAIIDNIEVISSSDNYLGANCGNYSFTTDATPTCAPITAITVVSIEI